MQTKKTIREQRFPAARIEHLEGKWVLILDKVDELSSQIPDGEAVEDPRD